MNIEDLKKYLSHEYQGSQSFLENIIYPIFGEEEFVDGYEAEILDNYPEYRKMADATGIRSVKDVGNISMVNLCKSSIYLYQIAS